MNEGALRATVQIGHVHSYTVVRTENVKRCIWEPSYKCLEALRVLVGEVVVEVDLPVDEGGEGHPGGEETAQHQEGAHCSRDRV